MSPIKPLSPKKSKPIQRKINTTFLAAAKLVKPKTPIKSLPKPFHMKNISPAKKVQYLETYRKKEDRAKLKGFDCIECKKVIFYGTVKLLMSYGFGDKIINIFSENLGVCSIGLVLG